MGETTDNQPGAAGETRPAIDWAQVNLLAATAAAAMEFAHRDGVDVTLGKGLVWEAGAAQTDPKDPSQIDKNSTTEDVPQPD